MTTWLSRLPRLIIASLVLSLLSAGCSTAVPSLTEPTEVRFAADDVGKVPAGFFPALTGGGPPPAWATRTDPSAPGGPNVVVQESADDTSYRFPLCVYDRVVAKDVSAEVRFKALAGTVDQAGGVVVRYRPENYYVARANALEDNVNLFKTVDGKRLKIAEVPVKVAPNAWHTIGLSAKGSHLIVTFNGKVVIEADDASIADAGKVGLWTKADSVSAFSALRIKPVP